MWPYWLIGYCVSAYAAAFLMACVALEKYPPKNDSERQAIVFNLALSPVTFPIVTIAALVCYFLAILKSR